MSKFFAAIFAFLGPAANSIKGHVNVIELTRALMTGLAAGGSVASIYAAVGKSLPSIVAPSDLSLAFAAFVFFGEVYRRLGHGSELPEPKVLQIPSRSPAA